MDKIASSSDRHPAVVQGQEDLAGVKSVQIKRNFKKNSEEEYVITQSTRTEMVYDSADQAKNAYLNIHDAKEEADFQDSEKDMDKIDDEVKSPEIESATKEEEKEAIPAEKARAALDSLLHKIAAVPNNLEYQMVGDHQSMKTYQNANPITALRAEFDKAKSLVAEASQAVANGGVRSEDPEVDSKFLDAEAAINNCLHIIYQLQYYKQYKTELDIVYDTVTSWKTQLENLSTDSETGMEDAKNLYTEIKQDAMQPQLFNNDGSPSPDIHLDEFWDADLIRQAAASAEFVNKYVPGAQEVSPLVNPGQVSSGIGAQNKPGLESYTKNNGYGVMPEHINSIKPYAIDQKEAAVAQAQVPNSLIEQNFPVSNMEHELKMGVNREHEHTSDPAVATEIALDHLAEDKDYYTKLNKVMPEHGKEEKPEREVYVNEHDKAVKDFDYEKVGKDVMFPGAK